MNLFIADLIQDLREKRLWPVALALVVALVAVPLVLAKPGAEPVPAPAPSAAESQLPKAATQVIAAEDTSGEGSALDLFDPKDPFRPPEAVLAKPKPVAAPSAGNTASSGDGAKAAGAGSDSGSGSGSSGGAPSGGGTGDTGGDTGGGKTPARPITRTQHFTYLIDVTFERNGRTRKEKGMTRLEMLPNTSAPLLVFLGVNQKANRAVFLVDSSLKADGEGTCRPSKSKCNFLYLGAGSEHMFTNDDGDAMTLRVDQIRRVKVGARSSKKSSKSSKKSSKRQAGKAKADGQKQPTRRFVPPMLLDLVTVSSNSGGASSGASAGR